MGRDSKRIKKVSLKGAKTLIKRSNQHINKAPFMKHTPESRGYALKEAELFEKQAEKKFARVMKVKKKRK